MLNSSLTIQNCNFSRNDLATPKASKLFIFGGGAVSVIGTDATAAISDSAFKTNSADTGGALSVRWGASVQLKTNVFEQNSANSGAAIYSDPGSVALLQEVSSSGT